MSELMRRTIDDGDLTSDDLSTTERNAVAAHPILARDFRSLSLFRIGFAVFLIGNFYLLEVPYFADFRGETGILPLAVLHEDFTGFRLIVAVLRLLEAGGIAYVIPIFFPLAAVAFAIGYRTRLANAILLVLNSYIGLRNPYVMSGAEVLTHLLLLWGLFVPLDRYWSVDAALDPRSRERPYPLLPFLALRLQIASLYVFAGLFKIATPAWISGDALAWSLRDNVFGARPAGLYLVAHAGPLLHAANYLVIAFQLAFPLLVYSPWRNNLTRAMALTAAAAMHVSFIFCLSVGGFPYVCLVMLLLLVPDAWIVRATGTRSLPRRRLSGAPPWPRGSSAPGKVAQAICALLALVALATNISSIEPPALGGKPDATPVRFATRTPAWLNIAATDLLVWQSWPVFTPPMHWNRAFQIEAETAGGGSFDVIARQTPQIFRLAETGQVEFVTNRWLKLFSQLDLLRERDWAALGRYLCRQARDETPATPIQAVTFTTTTLPVPGTPSAGIPPDQHRRFDCRDDDGRKYGALSTTDNGDGPKMAADTTKVSRWSG